MPIPVSCPECKTAYDLHDDLGGKRVVCAKCKCAFEVPAPLEVIPVDVPQGAVQDKPGRAPSAGEGRRRDRRDEDEEDEDRPRRRRRPEQGTSVALVVGVVAATVAILSCGGCGLAFYLMSSGPAPAPAPPAQVAFDAAPDPLVGPNDNADAVANFQLGNTLLNRGQYKEAEAAFREAVRLQPDFVEAHINLGVARLDQFRYQEAEDAFREAIRLRPADALAHCNLGLALQGQGRLDEALKSLRRGHELGMRAPGWQRPSAEWVRGCERLIELDRKLPAILAGDAEPADVAERAELVTLCLVQRRRTVAATRLAAEVPADDPQLPENLRHACFYNGACGAALAAAGQGEDAKLLPDKVVVMLRRQALRWLRAELAIQVMLAGGDEVGRAAVRRELRHWQQDPDLASVRDPMARDRLPDAEREEWRRLWADVDALLQKAGPPR